MSESVLITLADYDELVEDSRLLSALRRAGVDNWVGWDHAIEMLYEEDEE